MQNAPIPPNEEQRLAELYRLQILYTEPEATFDHITRELADIFEVPISTLSLIDRDHQFFKAGFGLPADLAQSRKTSRAESICGHVVGHNEVLVVNDLAADPRFADNPLVQATGIRFYAGAPLRTKSGHAVGSLCIIDTKPRQITAREARLLQLIAETVMAEIKLRQVSRDLITISGQLSERDKSLR
jgi:GAF domain-containing protein